MALPGPQSNARILERSAHRRHRKAVRVLPRCSGVAGWLVVREQHIDQSIASAERPYHPATYESTPLRYDWGISPLTTPRFTDLQTTGDIRTWSHLGKNGESYINITSSDHVPAFTVNGQPGVASNGNRYRLAGELCFPSRSRN